LNKRRVRAVWVFKWGNRWGKKSKRSEGSPGYFEERIGATVYSETKNRSNQKNKARLKW